MQGTESVHSAVEYLLKFIGSVNIWFIVILIPPDQRIKMRTAKKTRRLGRKTQRDQLPVVFWLRAGTSAVGLGASLAWGAGLAEASTGDDPDPAPAAESGPASNPSSNTLSDNKSAVDPVARPTARSRHAGPVAGNPVRADAR